MRSTILLAGASAVQAYTVINHGLFLNKNVDALVKPGEYTSHMHTFAGSDVITNVRPTSAELQKGCYSGNNGNDLSVYWFPTLYYVNGTDYVEVPIFRFSTYYQDSGKAQIPFPPDLGLIAGNASAQDQASANHGFNLLEWWCESDAGETKDKAKFPTKTCSTHLQTILRFPDCVNPNNLDEYSYSGNTANRCPANMKRIPALRFSIRYDLRKIIPNGWTGTAPLQLSCSDKVGDGYCMHGDFINGWFPDAATNMLQADSEGKQTFKTITGQHDTAGTTASKCKAEDADPNNGTSDYKTSLEMMASGGKSETTPVAAAPVKEAVEAVEETCSTKRSIGSKSKRDAARRALVKALESLDALEE
ncbi:hypothetical protein BKA66DRAFT_572270 [Pyrenochaeta sp. MPI-SDFR-AT-0127]|nr:hypothetical protein BKA66DRAFT_572270 [Pyrenochaeta sp. MPI-SDFR-AT-0127]